MLRPIKHLLENKRIVLASGSPRRKELMKNMGISVELVPSSFEEDLNPDDFPTFDQYVEETALGKVMEVANRLEKDHRTPDIIIGADTMVTLEKRLFGKPETNERAFEYLSELMGKPHIVYTGVIIKSHDTIVRFTEKTKVFFGNATDEQIKGYIETREPLDKAGGYGIQGIGGTFVERIEGDYFNVIGLPIYRLCVELCRLHGYP